VEQALDRPGDGPGIGVGRLAQVHALVGRGLLNPRDRAVPAVEDADVLGDGDLVRGLVERLEVRVDGAAVGVAKLRP
jgi:hypothetical protein